MKKESQLFPTIVYGRLNDRIKQHVREGLSVSGYLFHEKGYTYSVTLYNEEENKVLIQIWANQIPAKHYFYDLNDKTYYLFNPKLHRKNGLKGDKNIIWSLE
jgi:hypothetical protein